jgi:hypothetical protein
MPTIACTERIEGLWHSDCTSRGNVRCRARRRQHRGHCHILGERVSRLLTNYDTQANTLLNA